MKLVKSQKEHFPSAVLIGKEYGESDRENGGFGAKWMEWFQKGYFAELDKLNETDIGGGDFGFMTVGGDGEFKYWIGRLYSPETSVPNGYSAIDLPESDTFISWVYGSEKTGEIFGETVHYAVITALGDAGYEIREDCFPNAPSLAYCFERYVCPRYTTPDAEGNVILDYGFYID
ncbi:hypothetical protein FACS189490_01210 [Clostridia bacterium]|nr:hypothetical protein FACS189490_01210 [Clostridia bacterium]